MFIRNIAENLRSALNDNPVVLLSGARQVGKARSSKVYVAKLSAELSDFRRSDDFSRRRKQSDGIFRWFGKARIFDEIQRAPELFLPIKAAVDRNRQAGAFLLTGSANVLTLPKVADSLAGRMELLTLDRFHKAKLKDAEKISLTRYLPTIFKPPNLEITESREELFGRMLAGGFPEAVGRKAEARRQAWFKSYVATLLQRDVRDLANIEGLRDLPRLLSILAARAGGLLNYAEISRSAGFPQTTLKRYAALLEAVFLIEPLAAWLGSLTKRLMKTPKLFFTDTGLLASLPV